MPAPSSFARGRHLKKSVTLQRLHASEASPKGEPHGLAEQPTTTVVGETQGRIHSACLIATHQPKGSTWRVETRPTPDSGWQALLNSAVLPGISGARGASPEDPNTNLFGTNSDVLKSTARRAACRKAGRNPDTVGGESRSIANFWRCLEAGGRLREIRMAPRDGLDEFVRNKFARAGASPQDSAHGWAEHPSVWTRRTRALASPEDAAQEEPRNPDAVAGESRSTANFWRCLEAGEGFGK